MERNEILENREPVYGNFADRATFADDLLKLLESSPNWEHLEPFGRHGIRLIAEKLSRLLCGPASDQHIDNVRDLAGYATLLEESYEDANSRIQQELQEVRGTYNAETEEIIDADADEPLGNFADFDPEESAASR